MGARKSLLLGVALIAMGAATTGCATKKYAREQAGIVNARVDQVEPRVAAVEGTARDALDRATAAGKLAEGKFLYEVVLQDDAVKFALDAVEPAQARALQAPGAQDLGRERAGCRVIAQLGIAPGSH